MQDPFYVVRDEVVQALEGATQLHTRWKELLHSVNTAQSDEFSWTHNELKKALTSIEYDLCDLADTVAAVEGNFDKFRIDPEEIARRKGFVAQSRATLKGIEGDLGSEGTRGKMQRDEMEVLKTSKSSAPGGGSGRATTEDRLKKAIQQDNDEFIRSQQQVQQQIDRDQEDGLGELSTVVGNLREIGVAINDELEEQGTIMDDLHGRTDEANAGVRNAMRKVSELIDKQKEGTQWCIIILLILVLIGLVVAATQLG
jgi:syntaxin 6